LTIEIYEADLNGNAVREDQVKSIVVYENLMKVEEAKSVCKDRRKWKEVICVYPYGKQA
jgi:hypothetical protein